MPADHTPKRIIARMALARARDLDPVVVQGVTYRRVAFDLRNQAREALVDWANDKMRKDVIAALTNTAVGRDRTRYLYGISDAKLTEKRIFTI